MSAMVNTTNRQVDTRLNEIEQRLVDDDSSHEEFSLEEEEKNQESFIWASRVKSTVTIIHTEFGKAEVKFCHSDSENDSKLNSQYLFVYRELLHISILFF